MLTIETMHKALDCASVPMLMVDGGGRIVLTNSELDRLFGYDAGELIGQCVAVLVPEPMREHHVRNVHAFQRVPAKRAMGHGRTLTGVTKSGAEIPLEVALNSVRIEKKRFSIAAVVDVRVRLGHQRKMELAMEAAAVAMVTVDMDGRIVLTNDAALTLTGYSRKELLSQHVEILVPEMWKVPHRVYRANYASTAKRRKVGKFRVASLRKKSGDLVPVEIALTPIDTPEGGMVMSTITNLTQRIEDERAMRRKNDQLAEANRKLGAANGELMQFAYSVSHDLKAPLASLLGLLRLIEEDLQEGDRESAIETLKRASEMCRRSHSKIERVLKYTIEVEGEKPVPVDLGKLVDDVWNSITPETQIDTEFVRDIEVEKTMACPAGLELVVRNLLDNAVQYHDPRKDKARVRVRARTVDGGVEMIVADQGVGIPKEHLGTIFDMFKRVEPRSGDGIGLALVKKQICRIGGDISLKSEVGQGTSIKIFWPQGPEWEKTSCESRL